MVVRRGGAGGAVLVWWALGYRKAAGVFGLAMLARFGLSLVFEAHETAVGIGAGLPLKLNQEERTRDTRRAVRLLSPWALQHAEVIRIDALPDPWNVASRHVGNNRQLRDDGGGHARSDGR
jgi:hypothetical protein